MSDEPDGPTITRRRDLLYAWLWPDWRFSGQTSWNGRAWVRQYRRRDGKWAPPWLPRRPRWINALYARWNSFFWLPCHLCGHPFGGHEWRNSDTHMMELGRGQGVCEDCGPEARRLSEPFYRAPVWINPRGEGGRLEE
jgi:hypothetical protein